MRRSSAEIRRAIQFEEQDAKDLRATQPDLAVLHDALHDCLKWTAGERGTEFERVMKARNAAAVKRMPAGGRG